MYKPTLAAVLGLVCASLWAADPGVMGERAEAPHTGAALAWMRDAGGLQNREHRSEEVRSLGEHYAQVPASHSAYGWRYPFAFPLDTSQTIRRQPEDSRPSRWHRR
jgi:hypothetical protein